MGSIIVLNESAKKDGIKTRKTRIRPANKGYQDCIDEAERCIKESHRRYANAYQSASTFLAR